MIKISSLHNTTTRIFTQHDHGIISGEVAHHFIDPTHGKRLSLALVTAITTHDLGWDHIDDFITQPAESIPFTREHGALDFLRLPYDHKIPLYLDGIARCEAIHPYAGLLISLHYTAFLDPTRYADIITSERTRRIRLAEQLDYTDELDPRILDDYERLKFFDLISLFICMRAPLHDDSACPGWISPKMTLLGRDYTFSWQDPHTLTMDPFPFEEPLELTLPYRDLPNEALDTPERFKQAWAEASTQRWTFWLKCANPAHGA